MKLGAPNSMMTNVQGLYAFGEVNYQYHGATRLGANALLSCIFDGLFCGVGVVNYVNDLEHAAAEAEARLFDAAVERQQQQVDRLINSSGGENPYVIGKELGEEMTAAATVVKTGERMEQAVEKIRELGERFERVTLSDTGMWTNQNLSYTRALGDMLKLAEVILVGGIERKESRGSHFRTDFPKRDDSFLKTTVARYDTENNRPELWFEDVETILVKPRARTYGKTEKDESDKKQAEPASAAIAK
jgi:succinate dehydrogenase / fumarate reductase flavoprotein subunit